MHSFMAHVAAPNATEGSNATATLRAPASEVAAMREVLNVLRYSADVRMCAWGSAIGDCDGGVWLQSASRLITA